jgi:hypothetical protein
MKDKTASQVENEKLLSTMSREGPSDWIAAVTESSPILNGPPGLTRIPSERVRQRPTPRGRRIERENDHSGDVSSDLDLGDQTLEGAEMRELLLFAFTLEVGFLQSPPSIAADPHMCDFYAKEAVTDFQTVTFGANQARCKIHQDVRWHANYQVHYKWCLGVPDDAWRAEEKARKDQMNGCLSGRID